MPAYQNAKFEVERLVNNFHQDRDRFRHPNYNEEQVRIEFINPLFSALGWEVENSLHVVHEDRVLVDEGGEKRVKHPDYGFRTGRDIRFYVEAKKPSVNLQDDPDPAYQVRRYGWSRSLPLSVLTDFEELIVYNCLQRPTPDDAAHIARLRYLTYDTYPEQWDDIFGLLSYEAVLDGALERFVEEQKPKGTLTVDDAFLQEMERWRELLAKDIAERNPDLTRRQLNIAVQRTIDRLVFLRITEDRNIEPYGRLNRIAQDRDDVYGELKRLYAGANDKYNSGLFHFTDDVDDEVGDPISLKIGVGGEALRTIITNLYYPHSPYEFSVLPSDILGQVYERFLGSVIVLENGSARVEEKPEVRKAGGVYYTPTYVVDYIVENTVGVLVEGKNPNQIASLRILDPACGSGSFLIRTYQYLIDWHLNYYVDLVRDNPGSTYRGRIREADDPSQPYALTTDEKKRILLNNIYGVDLDQQAVEVTKLSLLLKMLEEETAATSTQYAMFGTDEQLLPDLAENVKWGNSLIGSDFYAGRQLSMFDDEAVYRVKAFDWDSDDGFGYILRDGGFDAVIGNPPWGAEFDDDELEYHRQKNRPIIVRMIDSFMYFAYGAIQKLQPGGHFGMILPDVVLYQTDNAKLRKYLLSNTQIEAILNMGDVFQKVTRPAAILVARNGTVTSNSIKTADLTFFNKSEKPTAIQNGENFSLLEQAHIAEIPGELFISTDLDLYSIWTRLKQAPYEELETLVDEDGIQRGVSPDLKAAFLVPSDAITEYSLERNKLFRVLTGGIHVKRYYVHHPDLWLIYTSRNDDFHSLPNICKYVDQFRDQITCKEVKQGKHPIYSLHRPRKERIFKKKEKLVGVITEDEIVVGLDTDQTYATDGIYLFGVHDNIEIRYIMGILNSHLFVFVYRLLALEKGRVLAQVKPTLLKQLPIRKIDFDNPTEVAKHDEMVKLVRAMLDLRRQLPEASGVTKRLIEQQITRTDHDIDNLVYELYGLTEDEIALVEAN